MGDGVAMAEISGTLKVGEASHTAEALMKRQQGTNASSAWILLAFFIVTGLGAGLLANLVLGGVGSNSYRFSGAVGVIAGGCAYLLARRHLVMSRFKRNFRERQQTLELPIRLEISHDHLLYEVGGVTQLAKWPVVDELFRSHEYWIFHAQAHALFAPRRLFSSEEAERKFLALALAHMSSDARARSAEALRFAGAEGPAD